MGFKSTMTLSERFWSQVEKTAGCWMWIGRKDRHGYGRFWVGPKNEKVGAHRLSWELAHGAIGGGLHVLHRCDVPACVRPDHLWLGTMADNLRDAASKGRIAEQRVTHCPQGHEYDLLNTIITRTARTGAPRRVCRKCRTAMLKRRLLAEVKEP